MAGILELQEKIAFYGEFHQNPTNQKIHRICVPMLMFSVLGILDSIPGPLNWAYIAVIGLFYYYYRYQSPVVLALSFILAIPALILLSLLGTWEFKISLGLFVIAFIAEIVGHKIEGTTPAFIENSEMLLIGPLWVFHGYIEYV